MEKKGEITQYRKRLDKTLASTELRNEGMLKTLIKEQLVHSSEQGIKDYSEYLLEKRTKEVSNFLDMLRSASVDDNEATKDGEMAHAAWKLKQDTEEFRVMYSEGPNGSPYHSLLAEGYVDGPLDICMCINWETGLYKKWWPQSTIPSFKIISCKCVKKIRIGEQISLVRVKVSWPLSTREAVVHYFEFEYFQDDLIVALLNTIPDLDSIDESINGFTKDGIPQAKDVVRIDVVGGFALQKVTPTRSYFRTIASMDIKLDFVPPSLINFISRQLIGNGFKLYQKVVASRFDNDEDFKEALADPLYSRIREALYLVNQHMTPLEQNEPKSETCTFSEDHTICNMQSNLSALGGKVQRNDHVTESLPDQLKISDTKTFGEIEEESEESITLEEGSKQDTEIGGNIMDKKLPVMNDRRVHISPEVQQALGTLEKAITMIRESRLNSQRESSGFTDEEPPEMKEIGVKDSTSQTTGASWSNKEVCVEVPKKESMERTVQEPRSSSGSFNSRHTESNSYVREVNHNKIVPASPEENNLTSNVSNPGKGAADLQIATDSNEQARIEINGIDEDSSKGVYMLKQQKRNRLCCFQFKF